MLARIAIGLALAAQARSETTAISSNAIKSIKSLIAGIDKMLTEQMNEVLHAPEVREIEGTWRGLWYLVNNTETDQKLKIRVMNISKTELADTLEDFEGQMWDQSPVFRKVYTDEYSMFGGEPFGCLVGGYEFSNHPKDVGLLRNLSGYLRDDAELVRRHAFELPLVEALPYRVERPPLRASGALAARIVQPWPCGLRWDRFLARELGLSRSELVSAWQRGNIAVPGVVSLSRPIADGQEFRKGTDLRI